MYFGFTLACVVQSYVCRVISTVYVHAFGMKPLLAVYCFPHWVLI